MWIRSLLFNGVFLVGTALVLIVVLPILLTTTARALRFVEWWSAVVDGALRWLVGLDYEIRGRENIADEPVIYACKHQSAWDTYLFFLIFPQPAYIMKKELMRIPIWGQFARKCRAISVDREGGASALKTLIHDTKDRLAAGRPVIIFPEGTRTAPGRRIPYNPGIAALYAQCNVPVVPVALNSGMFWGRRSYLKYPGRIRVAFMPAIEPGLKRRDFMTRLEDSIETAASRLAVEAARAYPQVAFRLDTDDAEPADAVGEPVDKTSD